ncbi:MAG: hypothetical protein MMC33_005270 [Icmadophila ericetorum]|nr:hypothetical protein [Icmadophila ericetorum]
MVLCRDKDLFIYFSKFSYGLSSIENINLEDTTNAAWFPRRYVYPAYSPRYIKAPKLLPVDTYIKRVKIAKYGWTCVTSPKITNLVAAEICVVEDRLVTGFCFARYKELTLDGIDAATGYSWVKDWFLLLDGVKRGFEYLNSLGWRHRSLSIFDIMLREDGDPVVLGLGNLVPCTKDDDGSARARRFLDRLGISVKEEKWDG